MSVEMNYSFFSLLIKLPMWSVCGFTRQELALKVHVGTGSGGGGGGGEGNQPVIIRNLKGSKLVLDMC